MSEPTTKKAFDCVEMKRRGADAIRKRLEGRTPAEVLRYWQERTEEVKRRSTGKPLDRERNSDQ